MTAPTQPRVSGWDHEILAKTIWGEARGEGFRGMLAVGWVARNRATRGGWWGDSIANVCQKPFQFSCWNADDPNSSKLYHLTLDTPQYLTAFGIAALVLTADLADPTEGATHYCTKDVAAHTLWAKRMKQTAEIGHHVFFQET